MLLPTQEDALRFVRDDPRDLLLWEGDVRSGKSHGAALALLIHSLEYEGREFIVGGRTAGSVERNVIPKLRIAADVLGLKMRRVRSRGILEIGANEFHVFGAPNVMAQDVVQGMDSAGALIDEAALIDRGFVEQALSRASVPGAKNILTFNPAHPTHWMKTDYVDSGDEGTLFLRARLLDAVDAGVIPRDYYEAQLRRLPPHKRKRWLEGVWAPAEGLCVPSLVERDAPAEAHRGAWRRVEAGVDFGIRNATAAVFFAEYELGKWVTVGEYYWNAGERTAADHAEAISGTGSALGCSRYWCDPSAAALKLELRRAGCPGIVNADNAVITGIDTLESACADGRLIVTGDAPNLLREAGSYAWREWEGEDQPDPKVDDHALDGSRYFAMGRLRRVDLTPVVKPRVFA